MVESARTYKQCSSWKTSNVARYPLPSARAMEVRLMALRSSPLMTRFCPFKFLRSSRLLRTGYTLTPRVFIPRIGLFIPGCAFERVHVIYRIVHKDRLVANRTSGWSYKDVRSDFQTLRPENLLTHSRSSLVLAHNLRWIDYRGEEELSIAGR